MPAVDGKDFVEEKQEHRLGKRLEQVAGSRPFIRDYCGFAIFFGYLRTSVMPNLALPGPRPL